MIDTADDRECDWCGNEAPQLTTLDSDAWCVCARCLAQHCGDPLIPIGALPIVQPKETLS